MDAATAAAMSDPERNRLFRRRWMEPPHNPPVCGQAVGDIELTGRALLNEWRRMRSRERMAVVASGSERAGPPYPSGRRPDGLVTT
jgi:hypothetical protein